MGAVSLTVYLGYLRVVMAVPLFYYTKKDDFECINQLGLIWTSMGVAGYGVYLTEITPESGRAKLAQHMMMSQNDDVMPDVCLETDSSAVPAEKLEAYPEDKIWKSKVQLGLVSFSSFYVPISELSWKKKVISFIKAEHKTLKPDSKLPVSQLQEMVIRLGIQPEYREKFDGSIFVCIVSIGSQFATGKGGTRQIAKAEAAKLMLRQLILRNREDRRTETRHVYLDDHNKIRVNVVLNEDLTALSNSVGGICLAESKPELYNSLDHQSSTINDKLTKFQAVSRTSVENITHVNGGHAVETNVNPVGELQEFCVKNYLPSPIYDIIPLENNTEVNNSFLSSVKVGNIISEGKSVSKKGAKKAAATDMLHKLRILSLDELREQRVEHTNAPVFRDVIEVQNACHSSQDPLNPVGELQEYCVAKRLPLPVYKDVGETGPPHAKAFTVQCFFLQYSEKGNGSSKKIAKHNAALKMLRFVTNEIL